MPLDMELEAQVPNQRYAGDSKLFVVFYMKAVKNGFKSEQEGRPIFDDVPHIRIYTPGDKTNIVDVPAEESHKSRFAAQWEKFLKGMEQSPVGTPVEEWPQLTVSQVQEFKALNLFTVEQVAGMADSATQKFMGGHGLKRKAQAFIDNAKDSAVAQRLAVENAELNEKVDSQQAQITRLSAQVEALMQKADAPSAQLGEPKRRGRPPNQT